MNDPAFVAHCLELLASVGAPRARRMFGGDGVYVDDLFVALIVRDELFLKADDSTRPAFEAAGGHPFKYHGHDGEVGVMSYWTVPDEAMESPREMVPWARRAVAAAVAARGAKKPVAKKAVARKATAKKAAAKKAPTKKPAASKSPARPKAAKPPA